MVRYLIKGVLAVLVLVLVCQSLLTATAETQTTIQVVDQQGSDGTIFFDAQNNPHIFYYQRYPGYDQKNEIILYAGWSGNEWNLQTVNGNSRGIFIMDVYHKPHIMDISSGALKDLEVNDSYWNFTEYGFSKIADTTMVLDSDGDLHGIYSNETGMGSFYGSSLTYAKWTETGADYQLLDKVNTGGLWPLVVAIDSMGYPHVIYAENLEYVYYNSNAYGNKSFWTTQIKYAAWAGSNWLIQTVADNVTYPDGFRNLVLDSQGHPHICFISENITYHPDTGGFSAPRTVKYAYSNGSTWIISNVDIPFYPKTLRLDANSNPEIYGLNKTDDETFDLFCSKQSGTTWTLENIGSFPIYKLSGNMGVYHLRLAFDLNGNPHCLYDQETGTFRSGPIYGYLTYASLNSAPTVTPTLLPIAVGGVIVLAVAASFIIYRVKCKASGLAGLS